MAQKHNQQPMTSDVSSHKKDEGGEKRVCVFNEKLWDGKASKRKKMLRLSVSILSTPRCMR